MKIKFLLLFAFAFLLLSCSDSCSDEVDIKNELKADIQRFDKKLMQLSSKEQVATFLKNHDDFREGFLEASGYPNQQILVNEITSLVSNPYLDSLYYQADTAFSEEHLRTLEEDFSSLFSHIKFYYADFRPLKIKTVITGFGKDMELSESTFWIGMEYFLGKEAKYLPKLPSYIHERFTKDRLAIMLGILLSNQYNKVDILDQSLLAEMIYYGKAYYFIKKVLPCTPENKIVGYSQKDYSQAVYNQGIVWGHLIENELLYESKAEIKTRYIGERPAVQEIGPECPGRIGRFIGFQIVKTYMEKNPDVTLQELMANKDARLIFEKSSYKPKREGS